MRNTLIALWSGDFPLGQGFWHYAIAYGTIANIGGHRLFLNLRPNPGEGDWLLVCSTSARHCVRLFC